MKKALIGILLLIVFALGGLFFLNGEKVSVKPGETHRVVLTEDGFRPTEFSIKKGDVITFSNSTDKPFWPASDIHPTHGIYPEFDPGDALIPGDEWSFQFDKPGRWNFHDHVSPYFTGKVTVTE